MGNKTLDQQINEILLLDKNWDGEGALQIDRETATKAKKYIPLMQKIIKEKFGDITLPNLTPVGDGSIDLHWKTPRYEVLLNVPSGKGIPSYYGDDYAKNKINGQLELL